MGAEVVKGHKLGKIGKLTGMFNTMIHFKMFSKKKAAGELTNDSNPFKRRSDLIDPAPVLDA